MDVAEFDGIKMSHPCRKEVETRTKDLRKVSLRAKRHEKWMNWNHKKSAVFQAPEGKKRRNQTTEIWSLLIKMSIRTRSKASVWGDICLLITEKGQSRKKGTPTNLIQSK
jgi:hypothetical protein